MDISFFYYLYIYIYIHKWKYAFKSSLIRKKQQYCWKFECRRYHFTFLFPPIHGYFQANNQYTYIQYDQQKHTNINIYKFIAYICVNIRNIYFHTYKTFNHKCLQIISILSQLLYEVFVYERYETINHLTKSTT